MEEEIFLKANIWMLLFWCKVHKPGNVEVLVGGTRYDPESCNRSG